MTGAGAPVVTSLGRLGGAMATPGSTFDLSLEWGRCEPVPQEWDATALEGYAAMLDAARARGLEPVVNLHQGTHPPWLGPDFWLRLDSPERYAAWVATTVERLGAGVRRWLTLTDVNGLVLRTYLRGLFGTEVSGPWPAQRRFRVGDAVRALDHRLSAHVLGYGEIVRLRSDAVVSMTTVPVAIYEVDRMLHDVLMARRAGVARADLTAWLAARRKRFVQDFGPVGWREHVLRLWARRAIPLDRALPRAVAAVYDSPYPCTLDA